MIREENKRVAVCEYTKKKVVQVLDSKNRWICLHNDNSKLDEKEAEEFEKNNNN